MPKRLHMSTADYVAIAVSPALIMALVGSLVFFLIEVLYVGDYQARLNYVFALFVFAAVLIGRISIEMGSERAAMYSLPLAAAVFVVLLKFVEHPSPLSPLINLLLIAVVWWCAHKLTWDCTFIDDDEDSSGEGLMQRVGVDHAEDTAEDKLASSKPANELLPDEVSQGSWWKRLLAGENEKHTPGLWVLYFSLAALPLFGLGQRWIDATDVAGRRYAFVLLFVYVAAGLSLLVTTSFLGFRRYLRQRQMEMPAPMAATWVSIGGVLIAIVMLLVMLLPRPSAEYAISQPPWLFGSPEGLEASNYGRGRDAADEQQQAGPNKSDDENAPTGSATDSQQHEESGDGEKGERQGGEQQSKQQSSDGSAGESSESESEKQSSETSKSGEEGENKTTSEMASENSSENNSDSSGEPESKKSLEENSQSSSEETQQPSGARMPEHSSRPDPARVLRQVSSAIGGLFGLVKWLFYLVLAAVAAYFGWKHRHELLAAARDLLRDIRTWLARLFGRDEQPVPDKPEIEPVRVVAPRRRFSDFSDPFAGGRQASPAELVRYTFEAFEAWCADRGTPRLANQTPYELVQMAVDRQDPMYKEARRLVQLYSQLAYAGGGVSAEAAGRLQSLWRMMQSAAPRTTVSV